MRKITGGNKPGASLSAFKTCRFNEYRNFSHIELKSTGGDDLGALTKIIDNALTPSESHLNASMCTSGVGAESRSSMGHTEMIEAGQSTLPELQQLGGAA